MNPRFHLTTIGFLICLAGGLAAGLSGTVSAFSSLSLERPQGSLRILDRAINESLPLVSHLNALIAGVEYRLLGDAGPWVKPGCKNWLFLVEEMREYRNGEENLKKRIRIAHLLVRTLAKTNTTLIVLPVPDKSDLASNALCGAPVSSQAKERARQWRKNIELNFVRQIDLAATWPSPGFLRTDSHWDATGAQFAAQRLAASIILAVGSSRTNVTLVRGPLVYRAGDLIRLADLGTTYAWSGPLPDRVSSAEANIKFGGGLLDETTVPRIVLAGSSFSLNSSFLDFLQYELQEPVLQLSKPGSGFAGALLDLLRRDSAELRNAKVIVWEFPMRALTQPLASEEKEFLSREP